MKHMFLSCVDRYTTPFYVRLEFLHSNYCDCTYVKNFFILFVVVVFLSPVRRFTPSLRWDSRPDRGWTPKQSPEGGHDSPPHLQPKRSRQEVPVRTHLPHHQVPQRQVSVVVRDGPHVSFPVDNVVETQKLRLYGGEGKEVGLTCHSSTNVRLIESVNGFIKSFPLEHVRERLRSEVSHQRPFTRRLEQRETDFGTKRGRQESYFSFENIYRLPPEVLNQTRKVGVGNDDRWRVGREVDIP